jgi:hypothetical protein
MAQQERTQGWRGRDARGVVSQNLDSVESGGDVAIDNALDGVHDCRDKAEEVADAVLERGHRSWERQRPRIEAYMTSHPWIVFGGLILLAYMFSAKERTR